MSITLTEAEQSIIWGFFDDEQQSGPFVPPEGYHTSDGFRWIEDWASAKVAEAVNALPDLLKRIGELEQFLYDIGYCPHCRAGMPCMGCTL